MQGRHGVHSLFGTAGEAVTIECITLADAFARFAVERCGFLKLDCEGAEYEILLTTPPEIFARIDRLALEYHDWITEHRHEELRALFEANGFVVTDARPRRRRRRGTCTHEADGVTGDQALPVYAGSHPCLRVERRDENWRAKPGHAVTQLPYGGSST